MTILRQLKNTDNEKELLGRELQRMQQIDRVKVANARNSFFNPDTGSMLPTVDTMQMSNMENQSLGKQSVDLTREVYTKNELFGECERLGAKPS